jgi:hypothetical protein
VPLAGGALYTEVQAFYARQVRLLGEGDLDRWARTFTEDAVFAQEAERDRVFAGNAPPERRGRAAIVAAARGAVAARSQSATVRRYLIGMLTVDPGSPGDDGDGSIRTRYCALLLQTGAGAAPEVYLSTTGRDVLVRQGGALRVRHRINSHDNAAGRGAVPRQPKDGTHG